MKHLNEAEIYIAYSRRGNTISYAALSPDLMVLNASEEVTEGSQSTGAEEASRLAKDIMNKYPNTLFKVLDQFRSYIGKKSAHTLVQLYVQQEFIRPWKNPHQSIIDKRSIVI